jgi:hypothetical protein
MRSICSRPTPATSSHNSAERSNVVRDLLRSFSKSRLFSVSAPHRRNLSSIHPSIRFFLYICSPAFHFDRFLMPSRHRFFPSHIVRNRPALFHAEQVKFVCKYLSLSHTYTHTGVMPVVRCESACCCCNFHPPRHKSSNVFSPFFFSHTFLQPCFFSKLHKRSLTFFYAHAHQSKSRFSPLIFHLTLPFLLRPNVFSLSNFFLFFSQERIKTEQ